MQKNIQPWLANGVEKPARIPVGYHMEYFGFGAKSPPYKTTNKSTYHGDKAVAAVGHKYNTTRQPNMTLKMQYTTHLKDGNVEVLMWNDVCAQTTYDMRNIL